jgi:hypothetical protein
MEPYKIPEVKIMTLKTLVFVKNPAELTDTKALLGDNYDVMYENNPDDIEETVKGIVAGLNQPHCHLHSWESEGWVGYHIFISI